MPTHTWGARDAAGHLTTKTVTYTVQPAVKIGSSFKAGETLPAPVTHIDAHRAYFQTGDFLTAQTWAGQSQMVQAYNQYGCRTFSISVKPDSSSATGTAFAATSLDRLRGFIDSIPAAVNRSNVLLTFYHEHDGNIRDGSLSLAKYQSGSAQVAQVAHEKGCLYGPIHNGVTRQNGTTGTWGLWPSQWAATEADTSLYDFWGVDCYSDAYEDPSPRMDPIKTYADSLGLPVLIGELGSPNGTSQAAWCGKARTWALANTRWACYWSSQVGTTNTNYRLTDAAARAWFGL